MNYEKKLSIKKKKRLLLQKNGDGFLEGVEKPSSL